MKIANLTAKLDRMPMLKALVPFAAGIYTAFHFALPLWFITGAFLASGVLALLLRSQLCTIAMLFTTGFAALQLHERERTVPYDTYTTYEIVVEGIPADRGHYSSSEAVIVAWRDSGSEHWRAAEDRIILYADSLALPQAGERIICRGRIKTFGGVESYRKLMAQRGLIGTIWLSERNILEREEVYSSTLHIAASQRIRRLNIDGSAGAVCSAMVAGDKSALTPDLRKTYARSGLTHLLAVSGLHTGMVFVLINIMLWWLPLLRRGHILRNIAAAGCIWLYVAATGFPPSAVRAAVMCTMLQFTLASGSEHVGINSLATAAFGMLLWRPEWLGDISFQLSFIAVGAILTWGVPLCRRLHTGRRWLNILTDALVISLVASAATAPLVSHTFGIVSVAGLAANPIAIVLGSVIVFAGVIWMLLPLSWMSGMFSTILTGAAEALNALARLAAEMPYGAIEYSIGKGTTAGIYLVMVLATAVMWSADNADKKKTVHLRL